MSNNDDNDFIDRKLSMNSTCIYVNKFLRK